jgi:hypothetical protein
MSGSLEEIMGIHEAYSDFDMNQPTFLTTASAGQECSRQWQQLY